MPLSQYKKQALRQELPDLSDFPKTVHLKDRTEVLLRPMQKGDGPALLEFFKALEPRARLFLKDDVTDPEVIREWEENLDFRRVIPILAFHEEKVIGDATLHRNSHGWSRHVGEIRMVTAGDYRQKGLGYLLARELYFIAQKLHIEKVMAQMMDSQEAAIAVFEKLGFKKEAVLRNMVLDMQGKKHDLIIMTQDLARLWQKLENLAYDLEDHGG